MRYFSEILGKHVDLPDNPRRIVSLAPDITETLFRIGAGERVVGVSLYCRRPREGVMGLPRVGAYLNVLWDRLEALNPDLVFTTTGAQRKTAEELLRRGIPTVSLPVPNSVFGILENIRRVGLFSNRLEAAEGLLLDLTGVLYGLTGKGFGIRVYYEVDLGGPITAGGPSYITHALRLLGMENVWGFSRESYFKPDDDRTRALGFDLILYEPKPERKYTREEIVSHLRERFGDVKVLVLEPDSLAHYGPALVDEVLVALRSAVEKTLSGL